MEIVVSLIRDLLRQCDVLLQPLRVPIEPRLGFLTQHHQDLLLVHGADVGFDCYSLEELIRALQFLLLMLMLQCVLVGLIYSKVP